MLEFGKVVYEEYKISSLPFASRCEAYNEIRNFWQGHPNVTTYFDDKEKKWYIISK